MRRYYSAVVMLAVSTVWTSFARGAIQWSSAVGGNDHYYDAVATPGGINWGDALSAAVASGGYLATLTSSAENDFVFNNLASNPTLWNTIFGPWIGGIQPGGSTEPDGGWAWINGEGTFASTFANWAPGEPNDAGGGSREDRAQFFNGAGSPANTWNDESGLSLIPGYIVEFDNDPSQVVPEPATFAVWSFLGIAFLATAIHKRPSRRRMQDGLPIRPTIPGHAGND